MKPRKSVKNLEHIDLQVPNFLIKQVSLPQLNKVLQGKIQKIQKKHEDNLALIRKKLQGLTNRVQKNKNRHYKKNTNTNLEEIAASSSNMLPLVDKKLRKNNQNNKENINSSPRSRKVSKNNKNSPHRIQTSPKKKAMQSTIKILFNKIQSKLKSSQSFNNQSFQQQNKKLSKYSTNCSRYLSSFQLSQNSNLAITPLCEVFEQKQRANKQMSLIAANLTNQIRKLEEIDLKNSQIIKKYLEGQLELLEYQYYKSRISHKQEN